MTEDNNPLTPQDDIYLTTIATVDEDISPPMYYNIPSPISIYDSLSNYVVGQDDAKRALSIVAYNHLNRIYRDKEEEELASPPRLTTLIIGATGTGKSLLCQSLCKYLKLPYFQIDATTIANPHGADKDIKDYLTDYYNEFKYKNELYDYGVIYIDEIDKLFRYDPDSGDNNSNYSNGVIYSLLTTIDGSHNSIPNLDTNKLLFVFSGAFEYSLMMKNRISAPIGFNSDLLRDKTRDILTREDIENFSAIPRELLARINVITQTFPLSKEEIKEVLINCQDAIVPQFESTFLLSGSKLELTEEELDAIIEKVYNSKYGMRYNKTVIFEILKDRMFKLKR